MTEENKNKIHEISLRNGIVYGFYTHYLRGNMALDDALVGMVERLCSDNTTLFDLAVEFRSKMVRPEYLDTYTQRSE